MNHARHAWLVNTKVGAHALALIVLASLLFTSGDIGFVRDEGYYFKAADDYLGWFSHIADSFEEGKYAEPFSEQSIDKFWTYNSEHPALVKEAQALTYWLFKKKLNLTDNSTSFRLGSMLFSFVLCLALFGLGARIYRPRVGLFAVVLLFTMPRFFFHAHLACFDVPITAMTVLVAYSFHRSEKEPLWAFLTGVFFGLAVSTKHNAWFLMPMLGLWWIFEGGILKKSGKGSFSLPPVPLALVWMAVIGPVIFVLHWPWLWHHTWDRIIGYFSFHLHHVHYPVEYFGTILREPPFPFSFPFVMTWLTVPAVTLFLFLAGLVMLLQKAWSLLRTPSHGKTESKSREVKYGMFVLLNCVVPFLIIAMPSVPVFGGVKHWFPAMPFLALLAAKGMDEAFEALSKMTAKPFRRQCLAFGVACALVSIPAVIGTGLYRANGTAFYNEIAGGAQGAARLGMMRQFWGYASMQAMPWLNRNAPKGAKVHFHNTNWDSVRMYKRDRILRSDIRQASSLETADYFLFHNQAPMLADEYHCWSEFGTKKPVFGVYVEEAPVLVVYERPRR